jgi:hypothetical protein
MVPYLGKWLYLLFQILSWGSFGTGEYFFTIAWQFLGDVVEPLLEEWQSQMMSFYESIKESIEESIGVLAPQQANSYALMNSGISSMLDSESSEYENYQSVLENGGNSFSFTDGQGRGHSVSVSVALDQIGSWHLYKTVDNLGELQDKIFDYDIISTIMAALFYVMMLVEWRYAQAAIPQVPCSGGVAWHIMACPPICVCIIPNIAYQFFMPWWWHLAMYALMIGNFVLLKPIIDDIEDGIQENGIVTDPSGDEILVTISDVDHSRNVDSVTVTQDHDGANLGLWSTSYPQIRSSASSTFEGGSVDGHGASQTHDPRLTGAN